MTRAVLSLGSNQGDPAAYLRAAVDGLAPWLVAASSAYRTPPWGPVPQPDYLNAVVVVDDPDADARTWLDRAWKLEQDAGRVRDVRWGPRTLDVDVVSVEAVTQDDPELTLPHPRAHERAFVLVPWLEVEPDAVIVGHGPVRDLVAGLADADEVRREPGVRLR